MFSLAIYTVLNLFQHCITTSFHAHTRVCKLKILHKQVNSHFQWESNLDEYARTYSTMD